MTTYTGSTLLHHYVQGSAPKFILRTSFYLGLITLRSMIWVTDAFAHTNYAAFKVRGESNEKNVLQ